MLPAELAFECLVRVEGLNRSRGSPPAALCCSAPRKTAVNALGSQLRSLHAAAFMPLHVENQNPAQTCQGWTRR